LGARRTWHMHVLFPIEAGRGTRSGRRAHEACRGSRNRWGSTRLVQRLHFHVLRTGAAGVFDPSGSSIIPGGHFRQSIFVNLKPGLGCSRATGGIESRDLGTPIRRWGQGRGRLIDGCLWHGRRRLVIRRHIIHILLARTLVLPRRRAATG
jgi:hypothetical protein